MYKILSLTALVFGASAINLDRAFKVQTRPENTCDDCKCGRKVVCLNNFCPDGSYRDNKCKCPGPEFENMTCDRSICWDRSFQDEYCMCPTKPDGYVEPTTKKRVRTFFDEKVTTGDGTESPYEIGEGTTLGDEDITTNDDKKYYDGDVSDRTDFHTDKTP